LSSNILGYIHVNIEGTVSMTLSHLPFKEEICPIHIGTLKTFVQMW